MGISEWKLTEFQDINWNNFTKSDDHIVPHRADEFSDEYFLCHNHKKPRHEVRNNAAMNSASDKYYATKPLMQHASSSNILVPSINISVSNSDLKNMILESTQESNVQFDWPDISNFEDMGKVFGNLDSTFDQQQSACINELPWFSFSSSDTHYGSEITFEKSDRSSGSNLFASNDIYESSSLNSDVHGNVSAIYNFDKQVASNHASWSGTNDLSKDKSTYKEKNMSQQKQFIGSSSYVPISEPICGIPVHQIPYRTTSELENGINSLSHCKVSNDMKNHLYLPESMGSYENIDKESQKHSFQFHASVKKSQPEVVDNTEREDANNREKVNSFLQLHYAIHQMDVITKTCIRDSLYRLARSASERRGLTMQNYCESIMDKNRTQTFEKLNRSADFMNTETNTNPIDRSIAHMLFHRPLETSMQSAFCTTQVNSYAV